MKNLTDSAMCMKIVAKYVQAKNCAAANEEIAQSYFLIDELRCKSRNCSTIIIPGVRNHPLRSIATTMNSDLRMRLITVESTEKENYKNHFFWKKNKPACDRRPFQITIYTSALSILIAKLPKVKKGYAGPRKGVTTSHMVRLKIEMLHVQFTIPTLVDDSRS